MSAFQLMEYDGSEGLPGNMVVRGCVGIFTLAYLIVGIVALLLSFDGAHDVDWRILAILITLIIMTIALTVYFFAKPEGTIDICLLIQFLLLSCIIMMQSAFVLSTAGGAISSAGTCDGGVMRFSSGSNGAGVCLKTGCPDGNSVIYYGGHGVCVSQLPGAPGGNVTAAAAAAAYEARFTPPTQLVDGGHWNASIYGFYGGTFNIGDAVHGTVMNPSPYPAVTYPSMVQYVLHAGNDIIKSNMSQPNTGFKLMGMLMTQPPQYESSTSASASSAGAPAGQSRPLLYKLSDRPIKFTDIQTSAWFPAFDSTWFNDNKTQYPPGLNQQGSLAPPCQDCTLSYQYRCAGGSNSTTGCASPYYGPWYVAVYASVRLKAGFGADFVVKSTLGGPMEMPFIIDESTSSGTANGATATAA